MDEHRNVNINLSMDNFEGVTAHMFKVVSDKYEARLDCIYIDIESLHSGDNANSTGKVVARINMSMAHLRDLYKMLGDHLNEKDNK